jgi:hypothetical protein
MSILSKFFGNVIKKIGGGKSTAQTLAALVVAGMDARAKNRLREQLGYIQFCVDIAATVQPDDWRLRQAKDFLATTFAELEP